MKRTGSWLALAMFAGASIINLAGSIDARAATITVTGTGDTVAVDTFVTLREAINSINNGANQNADVVAVGAYGVNDTINFNIPAAGVQTISPVGALPSIAKPMLIDGYSQPGASVNTLASDDNAVILIRLTGVAAGPLVPGFILTTGSTGTVIQGFSITNFSGPGISVQSSGNTIRGNFIGVTETGLVAAPNGAGGNYPGVYINALLAFNVASNNLVGGSTPDARNVISGNFGGVWVADSAGTAQNNVIAGNFIGTNLHGTASLGQFTVAIQVMGTNADNTVIGGIAGTTPGGTCTGPCNVIAGNAAGGILIRGGNNLPAGAPGAVKNTVIQGNFIGVNALGTAALNNGPGFPNIEVRGGTGPLLIGGATADARNVISGAANTASGIDVNNFGNAPNTGSGLVTIQGNYIGTNSAGTAALPNGGRGIAVHNTNGVTNGGVLIGGTAVGEGNLISGNTAGGVLFEGVSSSRIQGNLIGTAADGTSNLGNGGPGIDLATSTGPAINSENNVIGAAATGGARANVIAFNSKTAATLGAGIKIRDPLGINNRMLSNSIFGNLSLDNLGRAIDLNNDGTTPNDACDLLAGPNGLQNYPLLTSATTNGVNSVTLVGSLGSLANVAGFVVEFFSDNAAVPQARTYLGSTVLNTDGACNAVFNFPLAAVVPVGARITATATRPSGSTSEAAASVAAIGAVVAPTVAKSFTPATITVGQTSTLTITLTNASAVPITDAGFSDTYPANLVNAAAPNASTTCALGATNAIAGGTSISFMGGTIPANGSCTVSVVVTSAITGNYVNTIPAGGVVTGNAGANALPATATLVVNRLPAPVPTKAFNPAAIPVGQLSTLTLTLTNPNAVAIVGAAFTDTYPAGVVNAAAPNASTTCGGTVTAGAGGPAVGLVNGTIPASGSCTVTVTVTSNAAGVYVNSLPAGGLLSTNAQPSAVAATATLSVNNLVAMGVTKTIAPGLITPGGAALMTITLSNSNALPIVGAQFTDTYPAGLVNNNPPNAATTCAGGTATAVASGGSVALTGGTIPANGSCTVTVTVTSPVSGAYLNTIPAGGVTATNAPPSTLPASASLIVAFATPVPTLSLAALVAIVLLLAMVSIPALRRR